MFQCLREKDNYFDEDEWMEKKRKKKGLLGTNSLFNNKLIKIN